MTLRDSSRLVLDRILRGGEPNQFETYPTPIPAPRRKLLERMPVEPPPVEPPTVPPLRTPLLQRKALETRLQPEPFPPKPKTPIMTTPLGNKIPVPDIVMQKETESMLPAERVAYETDPQKWYEERDKWRSNRVVSGRVDVVFEDVMGFTKDESPEGDLQNFISYALWTMPLPIEQLAGKGFQLLKSSLSPAKRAVIEAVEQEVKKVAQTKIGVPKVVKGQEGFVKLPGEPEIPKKGKIIPKPVTPEVTKPLFTETGLSPEATAKLQANTEAISSIKTKLVDWVKQAKAQRKIIEIEKKEARIPKIAEFGERLAKAETAEQVKGAFGAMAGRVLPTKGMELEKPLIERLSAEEGKTFIQYVVSHPAFEGKSLTAANTILALAKKEAPTLGELRNLRKVLGDDFIKAYQELGKSRGWARVAQLFTETINIPKALFASLDFAPIFRQAIFMVPRYPIKAVKAIWTGTQPYVRSAKWVEDIDDAIRTGEFAHLRQKLDLTELPAKERVLAKVEEAYGTSILYRIPVIRETLGVLIKRSERVFVTTLNKFRADIFDGYAKVWGDNVPQNVYDELAELINIGTGRGAITQSVTLQAIVAHLNTVLFSPRLNISRVQTLGLPVVLWKYSPAVRKVALGNIATFLGGIGGILALVKAMNLPNVTVETNSTSTNFGLLKVGDTRYDPWGGHSQYVRFAARMVTGKLKTGAGEIVDINRMDETVKFFRLKESPFASFITDLLAGKTVIGEELTTEAKDVKEQIFNRITPGAIQDFVEAVRLYGMPEALRALPAFASIGVNSYPSRTYMDWLDKMEEVRGKEWTIDEIAALRPDFNATEKGWSDFLQLPKGRERENYREQNPAIDASLFFWGEVNELLSVQAKAEFGKLAQRYNVSEEIYPLRVNVEEFDIKGKKQEEIFTELLKTVPSYLADYVLENRRGWQKKDIASVFEVIGKMKTADQKLIDRYSLLMMGESTQARQKYRRENPDVDMALNFWNKVSTVQSPKARTLLKQRATELGIPEEVIPALARKKTTGGFSSNLKLKTQK